MDVASNSAIPSSCQAEIRIPVKPNKSMQESINTKFNRSPIKPVVLFPREEKTARTSRAPSIYDDKEYCTSLVNPLIASSYKRNVPSRPLQSMSTPESVSDWHYNPIDWSMNGQIVVSFDSKILFFDASQLLNVRPFNCPSPDNVISLCFSKDGNNIAMGTSRGDLNLIDVETNNLISSSSTKGFEDSGTSSVCASDNFLITAHLNGSLYLSDIRELPPKNQISTKIGRMCTKALISPDDTQVAVCHDGQNVSVFDFRYFDNPISTNSDHRSVFRAVCWSPRDRNLIVTGGGTNDGSIKIWDTLTGTVEKQVTHSSQICSIYWLRENSEIVTTNGFGENGIRFWDEKDLKTTGLIKGHNDRVLYSAIAPDNTALATITEKDPLQIWNLTTQDHSTKT